VIAASVLFQVGVGALLVLIGEWGVRHVDTLVPVELGEDERDRRQRVVRRGGRTCQVVGVVFVLMIVPLWI
jgi:hypothetical protein